MLDFLDFLDCWIFYIAGLIFQHFKTFPNEDTIAAWPIFYICCTLLSLINSFFQIPPIWKFGASAALDLNLSHPIYIFSFSCIKKDQNSQSAWIWNEWSICKLLWRLIPQPTLDIAIWVFLVIIYISQLRLQIYNNVLKPITLSS